MPNATGSRAVAGTPPSLGWKLAQPGSRTDSCTSHVARGIWSLPMDLSPRVNRHTLEDNCNTPLRG
eukprot:5446319-Alexandrium_andersonii.AAC.1